MSLRNKCAIVGVGQSRIGKVPDRTGMALAADAAKAALDDAGLTPADIDGVLAGYTFTEPYLMLSSVMCEYLGLQPTYSASIMVGGGSAGFMLHHAMHAIVTGAATNVLIVMGENRRTGQTSDDAIAAISKIGHPYYEHPYGAPMPGLYGLVARRHMHEYGTTYEHLAAVSVNTRYHASLNPSAQMRELITVEDVLNSRMISDPFRMLNCCLISDAGGAMIVTSAERAKDLRSAPVYVRGIGEMHTHEHVSMARNLTETGAGRSSEIAYAMAGVGPEDIDYASLYDCFSIVPIMELEELGFVKPGEGGDFFLGGHARLGGQLPVNTHGGMLSHAHAGGAGGLFDITEAALQVRGECGERQVEGAQVALAHVEGGILSAHCTVVVSNTE
ncbi:thiolase family protein [Sporichthya sp.]|uniref:thiolase family protein n=1 Tax=Sporichthya sp. TaxID=65475 RepID=UPI0017A38398|nr:thiolase family protein [Sporichthya sp.]MBA3741379.1 thiolase family protein [Sporichthya sp.]